VLQTTFAASRVVQRDVVVQGARSVGGERMIVMENINLESEIRTDLYSDDLVGGSERGWLRAAGGVRP